MNPLMSRRTFTKTGVSKKQITTSKTWCAVRGSFHVN